MLILHTLPSRTIVFDHHTMTQLVPILAQKLVVLRKQEYHMTCVSLQ